VLDWLIWSDEINRWARHKGNDLPLRQVTATFLWQRDSPVARLLMNFSRILTFSTMVIQTWKDGNVIERKGSLLAVVSISLPNGQELFTADARDELPQTSPSWLPSLPKFYFPMIAVKSWVISLQMVEIYSSNVPLIEQFGNSLSLSLAKLGRGMWQFRLAR
jgi:hypothetical protein